jgi:urocanate hydratase
VRLRRSDAIRDNRLALLVIEAVAIGRSSAPISFTRYRFDKCSSTPPYREPENMNDGSDAILDWPIPNALPNCANGADLVTVHGSTAHGASTGVTTVAGGELETADRFERVLGGNPGIGVLR